MTRSTAFFDAPRLRTRLTLLAAVWVLGGVCSPLAAAPVVGLDRADVAAARAQERNADDSYTPAGSQRPSKPEALAAWQQGRTQMAAGQLAEAEDSFSRAASIEPGAYSPLLSLADVAIRRNNLPRAQELLQRTLGMAPQSAEVAAVSGRLYVVLGRPQDAEREFRRAIQLDPAFPTPRLDLADLIMASGRFDEAVPAYRAAVGTAPGHAGAAFGLGRALAQRQDLPGAQKAFERSAQLAPELPQPGLALAEVLAAQRAFPAAFAELERVRQLPGGETPARALRVNVLLATGRTADAIGAQRDLAKSLQGPEAAQATTKLGQILEVAKRHDEAAAAYREAIKLDPQAHAARNNAAWLAAERKTNLDLALTDARKAVELAPNVASYHDTLGAVLMTRGDYAQATAALRKALDLAPDSAAVKARLAKAQELAAGR